MRSVLCSTTEAARTGRAGRRPDRSAHRAAKISVRARPGRDSFAPAVVIPAPGSARALAVAVAGRITVALAVGNGPPSRHPAHPAAGRWHFSVPVRLGSTPAGDICLSRRLNDEIAGAAIGCGMERNAAVLVGRVLCEEVRRL